MVGMQAGDSIVLQFFCHARNNVDGTQYTTELFYTHSSSPPPMLTAAVYG